MDLSIIIPTYNEKRNVRDISEKIIKEFKKNKIRGEIIFVDDSSPDGTGEILDILSQKNKEVRVIHRPNKSGLASAVSKGWRSAKGKVLGVIDADLSHNPEKIPRMMKCILKENYEIVIGSRYIKGGKILNWNIVRRLCSKISVALAKLLVDVKDPMSGFFMIKKECVNDLKIESQGFKILLETLIKTDCKKIKEIPISFKDREKGKSKAGFKEGILYLSNIIRWLKYKNIHKELLKFGGVGFLGLLANLGVLYSLTEVIGLYYIISATISFFISVIITYTLNKIWTFEEDLRDRYLAKGIKFLTIAIIALLINISFLYIFTEFLEIYYIISQILAVGIASLVNFIGNKRWTFKI